MDAGLGRLDLYASSLLDTDLSSLDGRRGMSLLKLTSCSQKQLENENTTYPKGIEAGSLPVMLRC